MRPSENNHEEGNMEVHITELRSQRRPLWMSHFGFENCAGLLGGGGDIWFDRVPPEWQGSSDEGLEGEESPAVLEQPEKSSKDRLV
jgi:hypothetical protein